eukprot:scaffold20591_cov18-Phaeocystis_antarctica.AAC.1
MVVAYATGTTCCHLMPPSTVIQLGLGGRPSPGGGHASTLARSHARTLARSHACMLARLHARTLDSCPTAWP